MRELYQYFELPLLTLKRIVLERQLEEVLVGLEERKAATVSAFEAQNYHKYVAHLEMTGGDAETGMTHEQLQGLTLPAPAAVRAASVRSLPNCKEVWLGVVVVG